MSEFECDLVRDLLPIYMDGNASKESKEIVEKHIASCPECKEMYNAMSKEIVPAGEKVKISKKILSPEKKVIRAVLIYCFSLLAFAFLLSAVLIYGA